MSEQPLNPDSGRPEGLTPMHDALLAAVAQQSAAAAGSADRLAKAAESLKTTYQFTRRMKVTIAIGSVVSVLLLVAVAVLLFLAATNKSALSAIHDCTNPGGNCAARSQAQTAAAVGLIVAEDTRNFELVTVCASSASVVTEQGATDDRAYLLAMQRCVAKLSRPSPAPRPAPHPAPAPSPTRTG